MGLFLIILSYAAAAAVWIRFAPYLCRRHYEEPTNETLLPNVSIVVPVRNEAQSISKLLASLLLLDYPFVEIIVVDDGSTDCTYALAASFPVKVISAPAKPTGWMGKTWACHVGAEVASGAYLLFTDADTIHTPDSLTRAISFIQRTGAHLVSEAAYHSNCLPWEKFLGPFYCLMHAGASPNDPVGPENPYALGQYLLMDALFYRKIEGHASVRSKLADDASLARKVMEEGGRYRIYNGSPLCEVQMYKSFSEFLNGWHKAEPAKSLLHNCEANKRTDCRNPGDRIQRKDANEIKCKQRKTGIDHNTQPEFIHPQPYRDLCFSVTDFSFPSACQHCIYFSVVECSGGVAAQKV